MRTAIDRTVDHVSSTIQAMPSEIIASFPEMRAAGFVDIKKMGGSRLPLGALVGRSRVFEIELDDSTVSPLQVGQFVPSSFNGRAVVRVRYDAQGASPRREVQTRAMSEQLVILKALVLSNWPSVTGLVNFRADTGTITSGTAYDDAGAEYDFVLSEITVDFSVDV